MSRAIAPSEVLTSQPGQCSRCTGRVLQVLVQEDPARRMWYLVEPLADAQRGLLVHQCNEPDRRTQPARAVAA